MFHFQESLSKGFVVQIDHIFLIISTHKSMISSVASSRIANDPSRNCQKCCAETCMTCQFRKDNPLQLDKKYIVSTQDALKLAKNSQISSITWQLGRGASWIWPPNAASGSSHHPCRPCWFLESAVGGCCWVFLTWKFHGIFLGWMVR